MTEPRKPQPNCNICGRFATWSKERRAWFFRCVAWDDYVGGWEHD